MKIVEDKILTVGDLKKLLSTFDDDMVVNFGTPSLGFNINAYSTDMFSLALISDALENYLNNI